MTNTEWAAKGIEWEMGPVAKQGASNGSDKRVLGECPIPRLVDLDKAIESGLSGAILKGVNTTSWRVMAQDVGRRALEKDRKADVEVMKRDTFARLQSITVSAAVKVVTITKHALPGGTYYEGSDEAEYQSLVAAGLVDMGIDADKAIEAAKAFTL